MTFSDDDLKRLKEYINVRRDLSHDVPVHPDIASFFSEVDALLTRLEAAEDYIEAAELNGFDDRDSKEYGEAWRKACGK